jgi:rhodanese-related sulfurtransferase
MMMGEGRTGDAGTAGTLRGIALILVVGLALGAAHNAIGRASRPPRGLDWVKQAEIAVSLDSLQVALAPNAPGTAVAPDSAAQMPAGVPTPVPPAAASATAGAKPAPAPAAVPGPAAQASPPPAAAPAPASASGLPVIPDLDKPIQIGLEPLKKLYDAGAVLIVDARTSYEYEDGHIAGAVNLPYADALADPGRLARLGEAGRPIAVYCSGGGCELSMEVAKLMIENGRRKVLVYEGGWPEWASFEYPTARGPQPGGR